MKKEILDRPLNSLVEGILDSYEKYPLIRNIDSTNRINRAIVLEILENLRKIIFLDILRPETSSRILCPTMWERSSRTFTTT